MILVTEN